MSSNRTDARATGLAERAEIESLREEISSLGARIAREATVRSLDIRALREELADETVARAQQVTALQVDVAALMPETRSGASDPALAQ